MSLIAFGNCHMMKFIIFEKIEPTEGWVNHLGFVLVALLLNACGAAKIVPYGQPQASVILVGNAEYIFQYGARDISLHDPDRNGSAENYLRQHPWILPPNCGQGIKLLRGGDSQTGGGWIMFECNKSGQ